MYSKLRLVYTVGLLCVLRTDMVFELISALPYEVQMRIFFMAHKLSMLPVFQELKEVTVLADDEPTWSLENACYLPIDDQDDDRLMQIPVYMFDD